MECLFIEVKHYHALCAAHPKGDGSYIASITFERRTDHGKTSLATRKFNLPGRFEDQQAALDAAADFARMKGEARDIGL